MTRVLIDSNVVLDWLLRREPFFADASAIVALVEEDLLLAHFAAITVNNCYYVARTPPGAIPARELVADVRRFGQIVPMLDEVLEVALSLGFDDLEDAIQAASAVIVDADLIVTRNERDFKRSPLEVVSPARLLARLMRAD